MRAVAFLLALVAVAVALPSHRRHQLRDLEKSLHDQIVDSDFEEADELNAENSDGAQLEESDHNDAADNSGELEEDDKDSYDTAEVADTKDNAEAALEDKDDDADQDDEKDTSSNNEEDPKTDEANDDDDKESPKTDEPNLEDNEGNEGKSLFEEARDAIFGGDDEDEPAEVVKAAPKPVAKVAPMPAAKKPEANKSTPVASKPVVSVIAASKVEPKPVAIASLEEKAEADVARIQRQLEERHLPSKAKKEASEKLKRVQAQMNDLKKLKVDFKKDMDALTSLLDSTPDEVVVAKKQHKVASAKKASKAQAKKEVAQPQPALEEKEEEGKSFFEEARDAIFGDD